jgi:hypothetical protein
MYQRMDIMRLKISAAVSFLFFMAVAISSSPIKESSFLLKEYLSVEKVKMLPVPADFRNYFVFQSIGSAGSSVLIGDFSGSEKAISLSTDGNFDNKQDKVVEFYPDYPDSQNIRDSILKPTSHFFISFETMRDSIISGSIYAENYSYNMFSMKKLAAQIKSRRDIYEWRFGYNVKLYDPDAPSSIMGEYYFSRNNGSYTLIFATYYYKLYKTKIVPPLYYSVYCKDSKDPKVKEVVDSLYDLMNRK